MLQWIPIILTIWLADRILKFAFAPKPLALKLEPPLPPEVLYERAVPAGRMIGAFMEVLGKALALQGELENIDWEKVEVGPVHLFGGVVRGEVGIRTPKSILRHWHIARKVLVVDCPDELVLKLNELAEKIQDPHEFVERAMELIDKLHWDPRHKKECKRLLIMNAYSDYDVGIFYTEPYISYRVGERLWEDIFLRDYPYEVSVFVSKKFKTIPHYADITIFDEERYIPEPKVRVGKPSIEEILEAIDLMMHEREVEPPGNLPHALYELRRYYRKLLE